MKINKTYSNRKHPMEYARKRRIMEILNMNKSGDSLEKEEKPNLKVAFEKFNSFIPSYPKKVLEGIRRSPSPISERDRKSVV